MPVPFPSRCRPAFQAKRAILQLPASIRPPCALAMAATLGYGVYIYIYLHHPARQAQMQMQREQHGHTTTATTTTTLPTGHSHNLKAPPLVAPSRSIIVVMEVHSAPAVGKRMWGYLRAVFFMARKGLLSNKRKLLLGVHLLMKRRNKAVARTVATLLSHHPHGHAAALRRRDYEFSCTNSPDPAASSSRRLAYFPCLGAVAEDDYASPALDRIQYCAAASASPAPSSPGLGLLRDLAPGEECCSCASPELSLSGAGRFSVRVSNYSSEDEGGGSEAVDDEAEEFIRRFYEQLRRQNAVALLPYMQESAA